MQQLFLNHIIDIKQKEMNPTPIGDGMVDLSTWKNMFQTDVKNLETLSTQSVENLSICIRNMGRN